ncbi:hypothetical protein RB195_009468 [Necator americanus]|uniref:DUF3105 domain-containing protein n=1 Tax=Necator americanus TaxID=51031 RepID=A0ABR1CV21_NECAM
MRQHFALLLLLKCTVGYLGPKMGLQNQCDDGKTNLSVDWNPENFSLYTCMSEPYPLQMGTKPYFFSIQSKDASFDPKKDVVYHKCMSETIEYEDVPPLRGNHRPNWARYGEYLYVPEQRWLHNLEHGSIILLYHPCADRAEVQKLRDIVTSCLYRHVITPYNKLSKERPLALVAWGAKLEMGIVDEQDAIRFIREHARIAPEDLSKDGIYDQFLIHPAAVVSDEMDNNLCPSL